MFYVAHIPNAYYLATWQGDPGRTLLIQNAKQYATKAACQRAIDKARKDWPNRRELARMEPIECVVLSPKSTPEPASHTR